MLFKLEVREGPNWLSCQHQDLGNIDQSSLVTFCKNMPQDLLYLYLAANNLGQKTGKQLAEIFEAIPKSVISLHLDDNNLNALSGIELAQAFAKLPPNLTKLVLSYNGLSIKPEAELVQALIAIPRRIKIYYDDPTLERKYDIDALLESYKTERNHYKNCFGGSDYYYGSFFSCFQFSLTEKNDAVNELKKALTGKEPVNLIKYLPALRNGTLGKQLRDYVKSGMGDTLVEGTKVRTVTALIQELQAQNNKQFSSLIMPTQ